MIASFDLVRVAGTDLWRVQGAVPPQPKWWTAIRFEADEQHAGEIAQRFSEALKPSHWYLKFSTDSYVFVVFSGKVFKYRKGDVAGRAAAMEYGLTLNIPKQQLDWEE